MDPTTFLLIAEQFQASNSEAERRTSIGRSYYALYNILRGLLGSEGVRFTKGVRDHELLVYYLTQSNYPQAVTIGMTLNNLRQVRNQADYDMMELINASQSRFAYAQANDAAADFRQIFSIDITTLIQRIKALPPLPPRPLRR